MRSQIFNSFKCFGKKQALKVGSLWSKGNPKLSLGLLSGLFFASSFKFMTNNFNPIIKNAESQEEDLLPADFEVKALEEFTDEKYKQALENKQDVIIVCNLGHKVDEVMGELQVLLYYLEDSKKHQGRKLKTLVFKPNTEEELQEFQKKYNVKIWSDTIFLVKTKYSEELKEFSLQTALYKFEVIFDYVQKAKKLRTKNFDKFTNYVKSMPSSNLLVLTYIPKTSNNFETLRNKFVELKGDQSLGKTRFKNIEFLVISDPETAKKLNINPEKEGQVYLMSKSSKYNHRQKSLVLNDTNLNVLPLTKDISSPRDYLLAEMSLVCKNMFVFEFPNFYQFPSKYSLVLKVDRNKMDNREYNHYVEILSKLHNKLRADEKDLFKDIKILKSNTKLSDGSIKLYIVDNEMREQYYEAFDENSEMDLKQREEILSKPRSFMYRLPGEQDLHFDENDLLQFIKDVKANKVPEYFESQKVPEYQKYSTKIVKDNFKTQILDNDKHHVLFFHSAHCHACQQYKPKYEQLALENLKNPESNVQFNSMDSDHNQIENFMYFHHTPIFMVLRKEEKMKPFVYQSAYFNINLLKNYIDITLSQDFIHKEVEKKIFKNYEAKKQFLKDYKLEEIK